MAWGESDITACTEKVAALRVEEDKSLTRVNEISDVVGAIERLCDPAAKRFDGEDLSDTERAAYKTNLFRRADALLEGTSA